MKKIVCNQKDKIAFCNGTGIYKIMCSCNSVYIGETVRTLKERINEHNRDMKNGNLKSAVALHLMDQPNHTLSTDSASLIEFEPRYFYRKFKEALYIRKVGDKRINRDMGMDVNPIWTNFAIPIMKDVEP